MDTKGILKELQTKRTDLVNNLTKVDKAIEAIKSLNGFMENPKDVIVSEKTKTYEKLQFQQCNQRDFALSYIRHAGKEVSCKELFREFNTKIGRKQPAKGSKEHRNSYQSFYMSLKSKLGRKMGLVGKLFKIQGLGREVYFTVDSAIKLQTEKSVQNPNVSITEIR